jgi:Protein of unknown function (DUF3792)
MINYLLNNIFNFIIFSTIIIYIILLIKRKTTLIIIHPILAIFISLLITISMFILFSSFLLFIHSTVYIHFSDYLSFPLAVFIGGLVATLISSKNRLLIGVLVGIIFSFTVLLVDFKTIIPINNINNVLFILFLLISSLIAGGIGGYTAQKIREYVIE